jgi:hypothetical protein
LRFELKVQLPDLVLGQSGSIRHSLDAGELSRRAVRVGFAALNPRRTEHVELHF